MKQRDIMMVGFPFSDYSEIKKRPAVIVSNNEFNSKYGDVIVCGITSNTKERPYTVAISNYDLDAGRLPVPSRLRADKLLKVHQSKIQKKFAELNSKKFREVTKQIIELISESR